MLLFTIYLYAYARLGTTYVDERGLLTYPFAVNFGILVLGLGLGVMAAGVILGKMRRTVKGGA